MSIKKRLDQLVMELHPELSRAQIQSLIMQGKVTVNEHIMSKPGTMTCPTARIVLTQTVQQYVCRAGWKLAGALEAFDLSVTGKVVLDAGLSTGGFTDCLLQKGAARVYGIDVGYGQVHEKIRNDARVIVRERTNLRHLEELPELVDLVTLDLSFISVLKVMDTVTRVLRPGGGLVVLITPQFEAGRSQVGRGGIVRDPVVHQSVVAQVIAGIEAFGFVFQSSIESPILGATGNKEFLAYFIKKAS